ncbi:hypothetical protein, partial [Stieleria sp.]|uniref:hypothetical protein n=1 Tax=Stieleria sp. TaxID=2795976 RepID=UPI003561F829
MSELPNELQPTSRSQPSPNPPTDPNTDQTYRHRLRELELELDRIRCQADAARLDAQAAELELQIERLREGLEHDDAADLESELPVDHRPVDSRRSRLPKAATVFHRNESSADDSSDESRRAERDAGSRPNPTDRRFENWNQVRDALGLSVVAPSGSDSSSGDWLGTHSQDLRKRGSKREGSRVDP